MTDEEAQPSSRSRRKERLKWIASLLLGAARRVQRLRILLLGGLVARGELTARVLNADVRLWAINTQRETGLGIDRAFEIHPADRSCRQQ